MPAIIF